MKLSTLSILAPLCLALAGLAFAQSPADSYRKAGAAYFRAGQFRESVKAYQQVIGLKPNDADAYQQLGEAFTRLGMNKEAAEAFEKQADLLLSGAASSPIPAVQSQSTSPQPQPLPVIASTQRKYKAGQRVEYVSNGKWFKAVITKVASDEDVANFGPYHVYRVHSLGFREQEDAWVSDFGDKRSQLRPAGSGPTEAVPGGEGNDDVLNAMRGTTPSKTQPAAKIYNCEIGAPIAITGSGTYSGGTYGFDPATSTLTFHGGTYDGQRAVYEMSYGLARLHIIGPSGRLVIDCD
jgi:hypothetical protein